MDPMGIYIYIPRKPKVCRILVISRKTMFFEPMTFFGFHCGDLSRGRDDVYIWWTGATSTKRINYVFGVRLRFLSWNDVVRPQISPLRFFFRNVGFSRCMYIYIYGVNLRHCFFFVFWGAHLSRIQVVLSPTRSKSTRILFSTWFISPEFIFTEINDAE